MPISPPRRFVGKDVGRREAAELQSLQHVIFAGYRHVLPPPTHASLAANLDEPFRPHVRHANKQRDLQDV